MVGIDADNIVEDATSFIKEVCSRQLKDIPYEDLKTLAKGVQKHASQVESGRGRSRMQRLAKRVTALLVKCGDAIFSLHQTKVVQNTSKSVESFEAVVKNAVQSVVEVYEFIDWYCNVGAMKKVFTKVAMHKKYESIVRRIASLTRMVEVGPTISWFLLIGYLADNLLVVGADAIRQGEGHSTRVFADA
mmetsp:Transcript_18706/g.47297  ORF Transcript_18706/g.47297 Transcript_18706/m.47297 type:complete len:189 (-) Transcript_18706:2125-2691(-)